MPFLHPTITVQCDGCGSLSQPQRMTLLVNGSYDGREIPHVLRAEGWECLPNNVQHCPKCADATLTPGASQ